MLHINLKNNWEFENNSVSFYNNETNFREPLLAIYHQKDLLKLAEMGGATPSGTTPSGTTSGGTTKSDALNLANANSLAQERKGVFAKANERTNMGNIIFVKKAKERLVQLDSQLASLGYKVDATGLLVKI